MTEEGKVKKDVKRILDSRGAYYFMPVQNGMGAPSLDFLCCYLGMAFAIETKKPGGRLTARQKITKETMERSGCKVFVIDGKYDKLERWMNNVELNLAEVMNKELNQFPRVSIDEIRASGL